jgi:proline racemase
VEGGASPSREQRRRQLLARYRELVLHELPRRAREDRWVVTNDHCFGRIVLDHAVGGRWYDVLDRRRSPAFAQLDDDDLARAVQLAERMVLEGDPLVRVLDAQSLRWRGKPRKP